MKKIFLIAAVFIITTAKAQQGKGGGAQVEQAKIAFLTQKLELTPAEAEKFWPIFNEFRQKQKSVRKERKADMEAIRENGVTALTDKQADEILVSVISDEQKMLDIRKEYLYKFKQVLPSKKVLLLLQAEKDFNKQLIDRVKGGENPPPRR